MSQKSLDIYVCPHPECPDYYGATNMPSLGTTFTGPKAEDRAALKQSTGSPWRHSRAACPTCRTAGRPPVERVRVTATVQVPEPVRAAPLPRI